GFGRRERPEDRSSHIRREDVRDREHDRGEQPQCDQAEQQATKQIANHRFTSSRTDDEPGSAASRRSPRVPEFGQACDAADRNICPSALVYTPVYFLLLPER